MIDPIKITLSVDASNAADSVADFVRATKDAFENTLSTSTDRAKAKIEELGRKLRDVNAIIDENKKRVLELGQTRDKASAEDQKRIDQEIAALRRIIQSREMELLRIEEKRTKVTEVYALSTAKTEAERDAVRKVTDARMQEIGVLKDQAKAQGSVTEEVDKGTSAIGNYVKGFLGIQGAIMLAKALQEAMELSRQQIEQTTAAAGKLRDMSKTENDRLAPFYNEFGLNTAAEKQAGQASLNSIATANNLSPEVVQAAAGNVAANLRTVGISDVGSQRFSSLMGEVAKAQQRGVDTRLLTPLFQENPNITSSQLHSQLNTLLNATGGSASRANNLLSIYGENKAKLEGAHFGGLNDAIKLYSRFAQTQAPEAIPALMRQYGQTLDSLIGLNVQDKANLVDRLGQSQLGELIPVVTESMSSGKDIDISRVAQVVAGLSPEAQNRFGHLIGGRRGVVALSKGAGWEGVVLPGGGDQLQGAVTPSELTDAQRGIANSNTVLGNPPSPYAERIRQEIENEKTRLNNNPSELRPFANAKSYAGRFVPGWIPGVGSVEQNLTVQASENVVRGKALDIYYALMKAQEQGDPKATIDHLSQIYSRLYSYQSGIADPNEVAPAFQEADEALRQFNSTQSRPTTRPTTQPTTQPSSPTSINYHIRQINYGSSYDSIGSPAGLDTRYS